MTDVTLQDAAKASEKTREDEFPTDKIMTIVGGHFIHDTYTAFLAPMLPLLIDKLTLSLTQASSLSVFMQLAALFNVLIGLVADKMSLHYLVILAPAVTATLMSAMGLVDGYLPLALLLTVAGISVSAFHVPAPAMIGYLSGRRVGRGMSLYMAGGEMGRSLGPILVAGAVGLWGFEGIWRLAIMGWATSAILFLRFRHIDAQPKQKQQRESIREILPRVQRLFIPLSMLMFLRYFLLSGVSIFLVVFLKDGGYSLAEASQALALWSFAGVAGALTGGTISDTIGRKKTIVLAMISSGSLMTIFLNIEGWPLLPVLMLCGFTTLSIAPVLQATVLEQIPEQRATANGLFMSLSFLLRSVVVLIVGIIGDAYGLETAYSIAVVLTFVAIPLVFMLPDLQKAE